MKIQKIRAKIKMDGRGKIWLGKKEISKYVTELSFWCKPGETPQLRVTLSGEFKLEGKFNVETKGSDGTN